MNSLTLVEFPGKVREEGRNVEEAISKLTFSKESVELRLDPTDKFLPPIRGDIIPSNALLLKVTRNDSGKVQESVVIGKIDRCIRFRRMADFALPFPEEAEFEAFMMDTVASLDFSQYEKMATMLDDEGWRQQREREANIRSYPIPRFTPADFPFHNMLSTSSSGGGNIINVNSVESVSRRTRHVAWTHSFGDANIPSAPPKDVSARVRRLHRDRFDAMTKLFEERPIWLRSALIPYLPNISTGDFRSTMPAVAYFFTDGPWRSCWVRYGYDPLKEADARRYQVVEMRAAKIQSMIQTFPKLLRKLFESSQEKHIFDGVRLGTNMSQYQYCDLTFPPIQAVLRSCEKENCDRREGYYLDGTISKVRNLIRDRWFEMVKQTDPHFFVEATTSNTMPVVLEEDSNSQTVMDEVAELLGEEFLDHNEEEGEGSDYEIYE